MIGKEEVKNLAELALLDVPEHELEALAGEIDSILGYVGEVTELTDDDGEKEKPEPRNVMREDAHPHEPGIYTQELVDAFPDKDGNHLRVKKIL